MMNSISAHTDFKQNGFAIFPAMFADSELDALTAEVESLRSPKDIAGMRNLLIRSAVIKAFASSGVALRLAHELLQSEPRPVRAILFDKTADTNWYVTWHQDLSIPVQARIEIDGYGPWSIKDGVAHVQPPAEVLEQMVSLRVHLDACPVNNGAIKFVAGSHRQGIMESDQVAQCRDNQQQTICPAERGDVIAMRPLILHSSATSHVAAHRRVLHLEYASVALPAALIWAEA